ncbi:FliH/SctL family protein [Roseomonas elaeocarpi]|uniref:Flagellar assembly protein FliH/Type III secretion system HrpE domain-containing protein n=1 Tax=Roseomonas elaeocarpi TaxID=907779 RepID=A0ABV6JVZ7_9PROT
MPFQPLSLDRLARPAAAGAAPRRTLDLPDFGLPQAPTAPVPPPPPSGPTQREIDALLEIARDAALAEGRAEGERLGREAAAREREAVLDEALLGALHRVEEAREALRQEATAHARSLGGLLLRLVDAAIPSSIGAQAPALLERLLQALGPLEDAPPDAVLRVPPDLLEHARARLEGRPLPVEADPALAPGDARIAWRGGSIAMLLEDRRASIREVLLSLNLIPEEAPA